MKRLGKWLNRGSSSNRPKPPSKPLDAKNNSGCTLTVNRSIEDFRGSNLVVGCGHQGICEKGPEVNHPKETFYSIDYNNSVNPDLVCDFTKETLLWVIPDNRFDFILFEGVPFHLFFNFQYNQDRKKEGSWIPIEQTFINMSRILSETSTCVIKTADVLHAETSQPEFLGTRLAEESAKYGFKAGRWFPDPNNCGGKIVISKNTFFLDDDTDFSSFFSPAFRR